MGNPTGFLDDQRQGNPAQPPLERIRHYEEFHPRLDREARRRFILEAPAEQVYQVKQTARPLPEKARLFRSVTCARCGESVAEDRARLRDGETLCLDCFDGYSRGW